jgi:valyl-tRNA synthetase
LQAFTKNEFCDYYIEEFKLTKETSTYWSKVITYVINKLLKLWHPYIPFVTEEIYDKLWFEWDLITADWWYVSIDRNIEIERDNKLVIDTIREIRSIRADRNILPNKFIGLKIYAKNKNAEIISEVLGMIAWIVKADNYELVDKKPEDSNLAFWVIKSWVEVFVDTSNALDLWKEIDRLKEQITDTKEYIALLDKKLLNEAFVNKAPEKLVRSEMEKKEQARNKLEKLQEKLMKLKS